MVLEAPGLVVLRSHFDEETTERATMEANWLLGRGLNYRLTSSRESPGPVESVYYMAHHLGDSPAMRRIVQSVVHADSRILLAINRQAPGAFQRFHGDAKQEPVAVVHLTDGGALDYTGRLHDYAGQRQLMDAGQDPEVIPEHFDTVEANRGDVIVQMKPWLAHRGRNASDQYRLGVAVYTS